jgi:hypothetical protein
MDELATLGRESAAARLAATDMLGLPGLILDAQLQYGA